MSGRRTRLWDNNRHRQYWESTQAAAARATARKDGADTAQALESIWASLAPDERSLMEYLLLSGRRSVIALYEDELFNALVAKGLLQIPPGVGTLLMRKLETSFSVPRAVWQALNKAKSRLLPYAPEDATRRMAELATFMRPRIRL
jgi:hypothetical protein